MSESANLHDSVYRMQEPGNRDTSGDVEFSCPDACASTCIMLNQVILLSFSNLLEK